VSRISAASSQRNATRPTLCHRERADSPYVQHRGGPKGFIRVVDEKTLAFADYAGNRQYITAGNLLRNDRAQLFIDGLCDAAADQDIGPRQSGRGRGGDPKLMPEGYAARPEQAIGGSRSRPWDSNCPAHPAKGSTPPTFAGTLTKLQARISELEAENAGLRVCRVGDGLAESERNFRRPARVPAKPGAAVIG